MPRAVNQSPPNVDEIVIDYNEGETPGDITMKCDGENIWLIHQGRAFARRENALWVNITDI